MQDPNLHSLNLTHVYIEHVTPFLFLVNSWLDPDIDYDYNYKLSGLQYYNITIVRSI